MQKIASVYDYKKNLKALKRDIELAAQDLTQDIEEGLRHKSIAKQQAWLDELMARRYALEVEFRDYMIKVRESQARDEAYRAHMQELDKQRELLYSSDDFVDF